MARLLLLLAVGRAVVGVATGAGLVAGGLGGEVLEVALETRVLELKQRKNNINLLEMTLKSKVFELIKKPMSISLESISKLKSESSS